MTILTGFKGFNKDWKCRDFQFKVGETFISEGVPVRCASGGFHFCENPLDVLAYYNIEDGNKFATIEASGKIDKEGGSDSKVAAEVLKVTGEIHWGQLIRLGIAFSFSKVSKEHAIALKQIEESRINPVKGQSSTTGDYAHSSTTGEQAHSSTTGDYAHSSTTGEQAHSSTTGYRAHSSTTGDYAHSSTTGNYAHSSTTGEQAIASSLGKVSRVKGATGNLLILVEYDDQGNPVKAHSEVVGKNKIVANTWYELENGKFKKVKGE